MRGFCPHCGEYRSDDGMNTWGIVWRDEVPTCEKCGTVLDVQRDEKEGIPYPHEPRPEPEPEGKEPDIINGLDGDEEGDEGEDDNA